MVYRPRGTTEKQVAVKPLSMAKTMVSSSKVNIMGTASQISVKPLQIEIDQPTQITSFGDLIKIMKSQGFEF